MLTKNRIVTRYPAASDGYIRLRLQNGKVVEEHRFKMAQVLGRDLKPSEVVRHADGNRANNAPSNLILEERPPKTATPLTCLVCARCERPFERPDYLVKSALKRGQTSFFCGLACVGKSFGRKKENDLK